MALGHTPAPLTTQISDVDKNGKLSGFVPIPWSDYFSGLDATLSSSFGVIDSVFIASSSAGIGVTPITNVVLSAGLYRVAFYLVELQADNIASSVQVSIGWTDRGTARGISPGALVANNIGAAQSFTYLLRIDRATPLIYVVTYATTGGAPPLIYSLDITLEQVLILP